MSYEVIHISAECYPLAKTGGLGDVVGALPKYLNANDIATCVFLPKYNLKNINSKKTEIIYKGIIKLDDSDCYYSIETISEANLGYDLYLINIPSCFYRDQIYGYQDDALRFLVYQMVCLEFIKHLKHKPKIIHCHDHHTGLIPFFIKHSLNYAKIKQIKTVFTIHNGLYVGYIQWSLIKFFPTMSITSLEKLLWNGDIISIVSGIKFCDQFTTVSNGYLNELRNQNDSLSSLYHMYSFKSSGIVNGIDTKVWNPKTDNDIHFKLKKDIKIYKLENKKHLCQLFGLDYNLPLIVFIGRLMSEKGAELIPDAISSYLQLNSKVQFLILGSGMSHIENQLQVLQHYFSKNVAIYIGYNESLAHQMYASADFLLMPSIIEPCGLNQLYALKYGTIPIVRKIGGLKDTIIDIGDQNGNGITFSQANNQDMLLSYHRATELFKNKEEMNKICAYIMSLDFSWESTIGKYKFVYQNALKQ